MYSLKPLGSTSEVRFIARSAGKGLKTGWVTGLVIGMGSRQLETRIPPLEWRVESKELRAGSKGEKQIHCQSKFEKKPTY